MTTWMGVSSYDPSNLDIDGVRCTFTMPSTPPAGAWWISCYSKAIMWSQVGIEFDGNPFYAVFDHAQMVAHSKPNHQKLNPGPHTFEISVQSKSRWHFLIDNKAVGSYGMGAPTGYPGLIMCINEDGDGLVPATFSNISMRRAGKWLPIPRGDAEVADDNAGGGAVTGVYGHLQDASLPAGSVRIGGAPNVGIMTQLW